MLIRVLLDGVRIENGNVICGKICSYQQRIPFLKAIGWDVALTMAVVIEINDFGDTTGQLFIQRGWRNEIMNCYWEWKEHNLAVNVGYKKGRCNPDTEKLIRKFVV